MTAYPGYSTIRDLNLIKKPLLKFCGEEGEVSLEAGYYIL